MRMVSEAKRRGNSRSGYEDGEMVENMRRECENGENELGYFEGIVRMVAVVMNRKSG